VWIGGKERSSERGVERQRRGAHFIGSGGSGEEARRAATVEF
jgi:hypothetical protein